MSLTLARRHWLTDRPRVEFTVSVHKLTCIPSSQRSGLTDLAGAHLLGADGVPIRAALSLEDNTVVADARLDDPLALSLLWDVGDYGAVQLETTRLPARKVPYRLQVELARHRLMRISCKREEWGLFDFPGMEDVSKQIDEARDLFITALEHRDSDDDATEAAEQALNHAMWASDALTRFHAAVFLRRRHQSNGFGHPFLGAAVPGHLPDPGICRQLAGNLDYVRLPFTWRHIQPKEQGAHFDAIDAWVKAAKHAKLTLQGGPLLSFGVRSLPDWMYIWENDHDTVFDLAREHVRRTVKRYAKDIKNWVVVSGLHASDALSLNFEHMIELTRMAATVTKQTSARAQVIVNLTQPWGEYFATNQRTVPPLLYAEMVAQSGIPFDAFGLEFLYGVGSDGYHLRDILQISALMDRLANLGKPLHITGVCVPSASGEDGASNGGRWHRSWDEESQAEWLQIFCEVALSKPFVESVCMHCAADGRDDAVPASGFLRPDLQPKAAFNGLVDLHARLRAAPSD